MSFSSKARDWQVAPLCQVGGAAILGAGVFWFRFKSPTAGVQEDFMFAALAFGLGGSLGGANLTPGSLTPITCDDNFSVYDLNYAGGRVTLAGAALGVGYGAVTITGWTRNGILFSSQEVGGWSAGVSVPGQALTTLGLWRSMTLAARAMTRSMTG